MEQNPGGLLVKFGSVARQLLVAVEDNPIVSRSGLPARSAMARLSSMARASRWRLKARLAGSVKVCSCQ